MACALNKMSSDFLPRQLYAATSGSHVQEILAIYFNNICWEAIEVDGKNASSQLAKH